MKVIMKPETLKRRAAEREQAVMASRTNLIARLQAATKEHGEDSIYAEMLAEMIASA